MRLNHLLSATAAVAILASIAPAQGDMVVWRIGYNGSNANDFNYYGQSSGIAAYSFATQSCNIGDQNLSWTSGNGTQHPVMSQNMYRLDGRRFEHLGQSWLKHGFCALCESGCGNGSGGGCNPVLIPGCADTYWDTLNDGQDGGPKYKVYAASGNHDHSAPNPSGPNTIRGRLQVPVTELTPSSNPGAQYWVEGGYIHYQDQQNGHALNNVTWRKISVNNNLTLSGNGANNVGESAVYAWQSADPGVDIQLVTNTNEAGAGIHGYFQVASRVWNNGDGTYDYIYVVNNQNSTQGAYSFEIPYGGGGVLTDYWFNDVDYHSGELQDGTDWGHAEGASAITWTCPQTFAQNSNGNAINWMTSYSFGFTANSAPSAGTGSLTMFEPGVGSVLTFPLDGPGAGSGGPNTGSSFCDGSAGNCPCGTTGAVGHGCPNTNAGGLGTRLEASGQAEVSNDTFNFNITDAPGNKPGLILSGTSDLSPGLSTINDSEGLLCVGGSTQRGDVMITDAFGFASALGTFQGSLPFGQFANVGGSDYYQFWHRDPLSSCNANNTGASNFNFSNSWGVTWLP